MKRQILTISYNLPSTIIIFITKEDIFGKDLAMYTFSEQCEEVPGLALEDGTQKIFLNMSSINGREELVSLLQYMKNTTLNNPNITVMDERIQDLHRIVEEVKQSEEWEVVKMGILEIGLERGEEIGKEIGKEIGRKEGIEKTIEILRDMDIPDEEISKKVSLKYEISQADVEKIMISLGE